MKEGLSYFRIKTEWTAEMSNGALQKKKTEELVLATNYTEAEKVAYSIVESQGRSDIKSVSNIDITKTKIEEMLFNSTLQHDDKLVGGLVYNYFEESDDTGVGLYAVKVVYFEEDEKTGNKKTSSETIYTPAESTTGAIDFVHMWLKDNENRDFTVRDAKFDKAEAVLLPTDVQENKSNTFSKYE